MTSQYTPIITYAYFKMLNIVLTNCINQDRVEFNPIVDDEFSDNLIENMQGMQYIYNGKNNPSTRLQVTFTNNKFNLLSLDSKLMKDIEPITVNVAREEWLPNFDNHPDPVIRSQISLLLDVLMNEKFQLRPVPFEMEIFELQKDNEFAGVSGLFFPMLHFYNPFLEYTVVVRTEPVVELIQ